MKDFSFLIRICSDVRKMLNCDSCICQSRYVEFLEAHITIYMLRVEKVEVDEQEGQKQQLTLDDTMSDKA